MGRYSLISWTEDSLVPSTRLGQKKTIDIATQFFHYLFQSIIFFVEIMCLCVDMQTGNTVFFVLQVDSACGDSHWLEPVPGC